MCYPLSQCFEDNEGELPCVRGEGLAKLLASKNAKKNVMPNVAEKRLGSLRLVGSGSRMMGSESKMGCLRSFLTLSGQE